MKAVSTYSGPQNLPPQPVAGHTWHLQGSHLMNVSNYPTAGTKTEIHYAWALVPDESASTANPTEAEIERRVDLLIELEPVCAQTEDPEGVRAQLRRVAIRQLLAERGGK